MEMVLCPNSKRMTGTPLVVIISVVVIFTEHLHSAGSENTSSLYRKL